MEKEKLMTSFFLANSADAALTWFAIKNLNFQEVNHFASELMNDGGPERAIILKFSLMCLLLSFYAITHDKKSRFNFSSEKALQIGNFLVWLAVFNNIVQISAEII